MIVSTKVENTGEQLLFIKRFLPSSPIDLLDGVGVVD